MIKYWTVPSWDGWKWEAGDRADRVIPNLAHGPMRINENVAIGETKVVLPDGLEPAVDAPLEEWRQAILGLVPASFREIRFALWVSGGLRDLRMNEAYRSLREDGLVVRRQFEIDGKRVVALARSKNPEEIKRRREAAKVRVEREDRKYREDVVIHPVPPWSVPGSASRIYVLVSRPGWPQADPGRVMVWARYRKMAKDQVREDVMRLRREHPEWVWTAQRLRRTDVKWLHGDSQALLPGRAGAGIPDRNEWVGMVAASSGGLEGHPMTAVMHATEPVLAGVRERAAGVDPLARGRDGTMMG